MKHTPACFTVLLLARLAALCAADASQPLAKSKIDRYALVTGHNVTITEFDKMLPRTKQTPDWLRGHQLANDVQLDSPAFLLVLRPANGAALARAARPAAGGEVGRGVSRAGRGKKVDSERFKTSSEAGLSSL